jgi:hypothetical protein
MIDRRQRLKTAFLRATMARFTNNEQYFRFVNREYRAALSRLEVPPLSAAGARVVRELRQSGIAIARLDDFFPAGFFAEIKAAFDGLLTVFRQTGGQSVKGKASFLDTIYKAHVFTPDDIISTYLGSVEYAAIAARYMEMVPRFVGNSFWHTKPASAEDRIYSQLWHRDYNDRRLVKVFLYLNEVTTTNGPFEYVTASHAMGALGPKFDRIGSDGLRAYPEQAAVAPLLAELPVFHGSGAAHESEVSHAPPWHGRPAILQCTGPAGALIFADTFGLHRGGYVIEGHRDVIMTTYSTNYNVHKPHFAVGRGFEASLTPFMQMVFGLI